MATFTAARVLSVHFPAKLVRQLVGVQKAIDHASGAIPIERAVAMTAGDETRAGVEHLVLCVARAELGANGVPRRFEEFDFLF